MRRFPSRALGAVAVVALFATAALFRTWGGPPVDRQRVYRIGYGSDIPFHFQDASGQPAGLAVDMVREAASRLGLRLEWVQARGFDGNNLDAWVLMTVLDERRSRYHFSQPFLQTHSCFLVLGDSPFRQVSDLARARIAFLNAAVHRRNLEATLPGMQPVPSGTSRDALEALVMGRAEAAYLDEYAALPALLAGLHTAPLRLIPAGLPTARMAMVTKPGEGAVVDQIREEMRLMAEEGRLTSIAERWGFFPNLSTDLVEGAASARRQVRWLVGGLFSLAGLLAWNGWLWVRSRRQVADLARAQERLAASEQRWKAVVESEPECVKLLDADGRVVEMNAAGLEMVQGTLERVRGRRASGLVVERDRPAFDAMVLAVFRGETRRLVFEIHGLLGRRLILESICVPLREPGEGGEVRLLVGVTRNITEQRKAEEAVARNEAELAAVYDHTPVPQCVLDGDLRILRANRAMAEFAGRPVEQLRGLPASFVMRCSLPEGGVRDCRAGEACEGCPMYDAIQEVVRDGRSVRRLEVRPRGVRDRTSDGTVLLLSASVLEVGARRQILLSVEDITRHRQLEEQFRQAQKMEAIGHLAGGVAHDFNNILTAIQMNLELLQDEPGLTEAVQEGLREVSTEADRAVRLTRQLLLFSRRSVLEARVVDLNSVVEGLLKMLGRLLGEHIRLEFRRTEPLSLVAADAGMLEQVLLNLTVNARDAMPRGGVIRLATSEVRVEPDRVPASSPGRPGLHVCLSVVDEGLGIDAATRARLFEPFFTTKEPGKGTGLGLATVYGIVNQHRGWVEVESEPGVGTTFRVLLPVTVGTEVRSEAPLGEGLQPGTETILFVEDEPSLRRATTTGLRRLGYRVIEAADGRQALEAWGREAAGVSLVLSDMVMPGGISGADLAEALLAERPGLKFILSSGYSAEMVDGVVSLDPRVVRLAKPYTLEGLSQVIQGCLGKEGRRSG